MEYTYTPLPSAAVHVANNSHTVILLDPHVETAFWLIICAILAIIVGWFIDMVVAEYRRDKSR